MELIVEGDATLSRWGNREHNAENRASVLLWLIGLVLTGYWFVKWEWLLVAVTALIALTLIIHTWARLAHSAEKRWYKSGR